MKRGQTHCEFFNVDDVYLGKIPHEDAGSGDAENQKKREIVRSQGNIFHMGIKDSS